MVNSKQGTLPEEELAALCNAIKKQHWKKALEELNLPVLKRKKDWFTSRDKAYPYMILPVKEKKAALDIGAGF